MFSRSWSKVALAVAAPLSIAAIVGGITLIASRGSGSDTGSSSSPAPTEDRVASVTIELGGQDITLQAGSPGDKKPLDDFLNELAKNLGIDVAKLKAALKTTALTQLDKLVADGKMSKEMADKLRQAIQSESLIPLGPLHGFGSRGGPGPNGAPGPNGGPGPNNAGPNNGAPKPGAIGRSFGPIDQALATFLNTTVEKLKEEFPGKSLAQVAQLHGKSPADLKAYLSQAFTKKMQELQSAGKLKPEQVAQMTKAFNDHLDAFINQVFPMRRQGNDPKPSQLPKPGGSGNP